MSKLWQKDYTLDSLIEAFTVGSDYYLDRELAASDCLGSAAHAQMLKTIGILSGDELNSVMRGLKEILDLQQQDRFDIAPADEDCHTAIEQQLTRTLGEVGKKIHTGRSRNDQVQTALRIWMKDFLIAVSEKTLDLVDVLTKRALEHAEVPMPGRTHMQVAMPSSIGLWAGAYAEELHDEAKHLFSILELIDQSPLGSAASYGVPLPLDRELTAELMGFSRVQNNVLYANNSRGKFEAIISDGVDYICLTLSKIAQDLILFSMPEFGYFSLPAELCSGSSIMPQKKNPDALELTRSRSSLVSACALQIKNSIRSLPSGYNRDFQDTKEPLFRAAHSAYQCVMVMKLTIEKLEVHRDNLLKSFTPDIYATDKALELVQGGMSFRDAYRQVGLHPEQVDALDPSTALKGRTSTGTAGNLCLETVTEEVAKLRVLNAEKKHSLENALGHLFGEAYQNTSFFRKG